MDLPRLPALQPVRGLSHEFHLDRRGSTSPSDSQNSSDTLHTPAPMAMGIPNVRQEEAPPPLPPPRFNDDLAQGIDVAWRWGNSDLMGGNSKLAPIKPGSSLFGGYMHSRLGTMNPIGDELDDMDIDVAFDRRGSTVSTIRSPSQAEVDLQAAIRGGNGTRRPSSPGVTTNQRLQSENPLAQETVSRSSHAYDKHVLSKIGKSNSPPRNRRTESEDSMTLTRKLSLQTNHSGSTHLSVTDTSASASATDSLSRWVASPLSAGVSPGSRPGWRDYNLDHQSPSTDSILPPSSALDPELPMRLRDGTRPTTSVSLPGLEDSTSLANRSKRGSYDQVFFADQEVDLPGDDSGVFRRLNLGENSQSQEYRRFLQSRHGMKRRALSPPTGKFRDDRIAAPSPELYQRGNTGGEMRSPTLRFPPKHGSVSSTSSSIRQNSLASSVGFSAAGSSMTSMTSMSSSIERPSLDGVSASESSKVSQYLPPTSQNSPAILTTPFRKAVQNSQERKVTDAQHTVPNLSAMTDARPAPANRIGGHFICECCPKKPKKFDTAEDLKAHEMEKQYSCQYCPNRFKNKNEAERHQNSLHLRRHSWSCAAIAGYEAAFHPSISPSPQSPRDPVMDACGYCGEEFSNNPPDWDRRIEHLTNIHKFGECNQTKKFFRADHFRQHLKHSHAGVSGKWTNMLENACMKDEPPATSTGGSPTASDPGKGASSLPLPGGAPMGGATISEAQDEC